MQHKRKQAISFHAVRCHPPSQMAVQLLTFFLGENELYDRSVFVWITTTKQAFESIEIRFADY